MQYGDKDISRALSLDGDTDTFTQPFDAVDKVSSPQSRTQDSSIESRSKQLKSEDTNMGQKRSNDDAAAQNGPSKKSKTNPAVDPVTDKQDKADVDSEGGPHRRTKGATKKQAAAEAKDAGASDIDDATRNTSDTVPAVPTTEDDKPSTEDLSKSKTGRVGKKPDPKSPQSSKPLSKFKSDKKSEEKPASSYDKANNGEQGGDDDESTDDEEASEKDRGFDVAGGHPQPLKIILNISKKSDQSYLIGVGSSVSTPGTYKANVNAEDIDQGDRNQGRMNKSEKVADKTKNAKHSKPKAQDEVRSNIDSGDISKISNATSDPQANKGDVQKPKNDLTVVTKVKSEDSSLIVSAGAAFIPLFLSIATEDMPGMQKYPSFPHKAVMFGIKNQSAHSYRNAVLTALLHTRPFFGFLTRHKISAKRDSRLESDDLVLNHLYNMTLKLFEDKSAKIPDKTALTCNRADELSTMANNLWAKFCFPTDNSNSAIPLPATTWNNYPLPFPVPNPVPARRTEDASAEAKMFLEWLFKGIIAQLSDFDSKYSEEFDFNTTLYWQSRQVCPKCNYVVGLRSQTNYGEYVYNIELPVIAIGDGRSKSNQIPQPLMKLFAQTFRKEIGKSRRRINCENKCLSKQKPCKICVKRELCSRRNNSLLESKAYDDYKIGHAPAMLVIHLDRDRSKASGQRAGTRAGAKKNHLAVSIPEVLDITELLDTVRFGRASKLIRYKLNAMISHRGKDLAGGQYVSWTEKNQDCSWYKLSDDHPAQYWETIVEGDGDIPEPSFADVYAAGTEKLTREEFGNRETPVLLFYRRDFENERVAKGREPRNKDEGEYLDQEPREKDEIYLIPDPSPIVELSANTQQNWQMLKNPADRLRVEFKMTASGRENTKEFGEEQAKHQDERVKRMENTQATMKVSIKIGDKTYECHGIDVDLKRHEREDIDISITASHTVQIPDGQTGKKAVQIDLVDAYHDQLRFDEDVERKLQTEKKKLKRRREQEGVTGNALNYRLDEDEKAVKRSKRKLVSSTERDKEWADRWYNINENLNYTR